MRALVAQSNKRLAVSIKRGLEVNDCVTEIALDSDQAIDLAAATTFDVILIDDALSGRISGIELCEILRDVGNWTPVLMLLTADVEQHAVSEAAALDAGADDVLLKPFSQLALMSSIYSLQSGSVRPSGPMLAIDDLLVDIVQRRCWRGDAEIHLTAREFSVLEYLARHTDEALSKPEIMAHVWDYEFDGDENIVEVYIRLLRAKIDKPFGRTTIKTLRGVGYRLDSTAT